MYSGRNPSPPNDMIDFDFQSSENRNVSDGLKGVVQENFFKEALLRYRLSKKLKEKAEARFSLQGRSGSYSGDTTDNKCINFGNPEENMSDHTFSKKFKPVKTSEIPASIVSRSRSNTKITDSPERESITQERMSLMSLGEVSDEDIFSTALSQDVTLKNKRVCLEYSKSSSKRHEYDYLSDYQSRSKSCERDNEYRRPKSKSSRSKRDDYSSDDSVYSRRRGHHRSKKRSASKDSMSRKKIDKKSYKQHRDFCSYSNDNFRIISESQKETVAKNRKGLPNEDSVKESLYYKKVRSDRKEKITLKDKEEKNHVEWTTDLFGDNHYYCEECQLDLNGKETFDAHMKGKKHKKVVNARCPAFDQLLDQAVVSNKNGFWTKRSKRSRSYKPDPSHEVKSMLMDFKEEDFEAKADNYLDHTGEYYCNICDAHMNNKNMFYSHLVGKRHLKEVKKTSWGLRPRTTGSSTKKKAPANTMSRLEGKLLVAIKEPIVGLNYIRETQNPNGELYQCYICSCSASLDILDHITSYKHRTRYLETVNANGTIPNSIDLLRRLDLIGQQGRENIVKEECEKIEKEYGRGKVEVYH